MGFLFNDTGAENAAPSSLSRDKPRGSFLFPDDPSQTQPVPSPTNGDEQGIISKALEYLGKPASAVAGAVEHLTGVSNDDNVAAAAKRGWQENTDYKRVIKEKLPDFNKEHPLGAEVLNIAGTILADPLWFATPAKIGRAAGLAGRGAETVIKAMDAVPGGRKILEFADDIGNKEIGGLTVKRWLSDHGPLDTEKDALARAQAEHSEKISAVAKEVSEAPEEVRKIVTQYTEAFPDNGQFARPAKEVAAWKQGRVAANEAADVATAKADELARMAVPLDEGEQAALVAQKSVKKQIAGDLDSLTPEQQVQLYSDMYQPIGKTADEMRTIQQKADALNAADKVAKTAQEARKAAETYDPISTLTRSEVLAKAREAGMDESLVSQIHDLGEKAAGLADFYTTELKNRGLISSETAAKFAGGRHIRREYLKHVDPEEHLRILEETGQTAAAHQFTQEMDKLQRYADRRSYKLDLKSISRREDLPQDIQERLGRIFDATHPLAKGGQISADLVTKYDFLKSVADKYGKTKAGAGLYKLEGKNFGPLENLHVPREIYNEVNAITKRLTEPETWWRQAVSWWKIGKTILNPATHARNFMSNLILLNIGGVPAQDVPSYLAKAASTLKNKDEVFAEARKAGNFLLNTYTENELARSLKPEKTGIIGKGIQKAADLYQGNEQLGKMAAYLYAKDHGQTPAEAARFADKALFDYSKVPPVVDWMRRSGVFPFASFPYFASKATAEALYERPAQVAKYYKMAQGTQDKDEQKLLPGYLDPHHVAAVDNILQAFGFDRTKRMVDGKSQDVKNYLDLKYIYPFASEASAGPMIDLISALYANKDPFTDQEIIRQGMSDSQKREAVTDYLYKMAVPSFAPAVPGVSEGGYSFKRMQDAITDTPDTKGRLPRLPEAFAQTVLGLRTIPVNMEEAVQGKMKKLEADRLAVRGEITRLQKDKSLSLEERKPQVDELIQKYRGIVAQQQDVSKRWEQLQKREKKQ